MSETNFPNHFPLASDSSSTSDYNHDEDVDIIQMRADLSSEEDQLHQSEQPQGSEPDSGADSLAADPSANSNFQENENLESPEAEKNALDQFSRNTDWFNLARKLRQHNRELVKTVVQLEQALGESQETLQSQIMRSRSADTLIAQQSEELNNAQEQISRLFRELEASHQTGQRQQILIDNLSKQLQQSQERTAKLEQECETLRESLTQNTQQLLETERQAAELRKRLDQQSQQILVSKLAIEESNQTVKAEVSSSQTTTSEAEITPPTPPTPIQPWSSSTIDVANLLRLKFNDQNSEHSPELVEKLPENPVYESQTTPNPRKPILLPIKPIEESHTSPAQPIIQEYPTKGQAITNAFLDVEEETPKKIQLPIPESEPDPELLAATEELLAEVLEASQDQSDSYNLSDSEERPESVVKSDYLGDWDSLYLRNNSPETEDLESNYPSPTISTPRAQKKPKSKANVDLPSFLR